MSNFLWGAVAGALCVYLYLIGLQPVYDAVADMWAQASSPPPPAATADSTKR